MAVNLHWLCSVPVGSVIALIGLIGNIVSIIVWRAIMNKNSRRNVSTGMYLISLAVADGGLLLFFLLSDTTKAAWPSITENYHYAAFFSYIAFPLFFFFVVASIWLVVGVTLNRLVMITYPTKVDKIYSRARTHISIALILLFCFIINIPHFFSFAPKLMEKNGTSETWQLAATSFGGSLGARHYDFWVHCIFLVLAPWFSIAVMNSVIIHKLMTQTAKFTNKSEKKANKSRLMEKQMTRMLLLVTFSFLLLLAWQCITQCFWMLMSYEETKDIDVWNLVDNSFAFAKLGVVINSSINCLFYCFSGSVFRKQLIAMITRRSNYGITSTSSPPSSRSTDVVTRQHSATQDTIIKDTTAL